MKMKVHKNGFGKRNLKMFKLNEKEYCVNFFGNAIFLNFR